jgi:hypothetical protein
MPTRTCLTADLSACVVSPEDVAEEIVWVALRPKHVQVAEVGLHSHGLVRHSLLLVVLTSTDHALDMPSCPPSRSASRVPVLPGLTDGRASGVNADCPFFSDSRLSLSDAVSREIPFARSKVIMEKTDEKGMAEKRNSHGLRPIVKDGVPPTRLVFPIWVKLAPRSPSLSHGEETCRAYNSDMVPSRRLARF